MSLIEKALEHTVHQGSSKGRLLFSPPVMHKGISIKKKLKGKVILLALTSMMCLIGIGLLIYTSNTPRWWTESQEKSEGGAQVLLPSPSAMSVTIPKEGASSIVSPEIDGKEYGEKIGEGTGGPPPPSKNETDQPAIAFNEEPVAPTLVKVENKIENHGVEPIKRKERMLLTEDQLFTTHYNNALQFEKEGKLREAVLEYERALVINPRHYKSYNNLGGAYCKLDKLDLAVESYKRALALEPHYVKAHSNMGIALFRLDKIEEAIDAFKGALALDAKNIESYNNLGIVYKSVGEVEKARETFERALAMSPRNGEVHYNLAQLYESEGAWESAFIHYQQFLESSDSKYEGLKEKVREHLLMLAKHPGLKETDEIDEL